MSIERRYPFGPLDEARLHAFESCLPAPLPGDYRRFLVDFNGATVVDGGDFGEVPGGTTVETLFGLHDGPPYFRLDEMRANFADSAPPAVLVIGSDPYGNYFGLALSGASQGAVFFIDHERLPVALESCTQVATSFSALLDRVGSDIVDRPAPRSIGEAIRRGDAAALRTILEDPDDAEGFVHASMRTGNPEIVRLVLEHGGDANERGAMGETPLFVAAREDRADIARLLLGHGADPNAKCDAGGTAMEMATYAPRALEVLARAGAIPTTKRLRAAVREILGDDGKGN